MLLPLAKHELLTSGKIDDLKSDEVLAGLEAFGNSGCPPPISCVPPLCPPGTIRVTRLLGLEPYRSLITNELSAIRITASHILHDGAVMWPLFRMTSR